jgi:hypothetical protein
MLLEIGLALLGLKALSQTRNQEERMKKNIYYRTKDGRADYGFSLEEQNDGSLRAYVESMPSYGSRSTSLHTTHRLTDGNRHYVCWSEDINDEDGLKEVVASWSDKTQEYI